MKRRGLSFILVLAMVITMMPVFSLPMTEEVYATTDYPLWIGDTQVTSENKGGDGTWSYDDTTNKLTLNGFTYDGPGRLFNSMSGGMGDSNYTACIYYEGVDPLNLVVEADSSINVTGPTEGYLKCGAGIYASGASINYIRGNLTCAATWVGIGADALFVYDGNIEINLPTNTSTGVSVDNLYFIGGKLAIIAQIGIRGNIDMEDGEISIEASMYGIYGLDVAEISGGKIDIVTAAGVAAFKGFFTGDFRMTGGELNIDATGSTGDWTISATKSITVSGGSINAKGYDGMFCASGGVGGTITFSGGFVSLSAPNTAKTVVSTYAKGSVVVGEGGTVTNGKNSYSVTVTGPSTSVELDFINKANPLVISFIPPAPKFDLRDGSGFTEAGVGFDYDNPGGFMAEQGYTFGGWSKELDGVTEGAATLDETIVPMTGGTESDAYDEGDFESGQAYYAVWLNDGHLVRTIPLDFTKGTTFEGVLAAYGYYWDSATNTLSLSNFNSYATDSIGTESAKQIITAVKVPSGSSIILADGTTNNLKAVAPGYGYKAFGLYSAGDVLIKGAATLNATASSGEETYALNAGSGRVKVNDEDSQTACKVNLVSEGLDYTNAGCAGLYAYYLDVIGTGDYENTAVFTVTAGGAKNENVGIRPYYQLNASSKAIINVTTLDSTSDYAYFRSQGIDTQGSYIDDSKVMCKSGHVANGLAHGGCFCGYYGTFTATNGAIVTGETGGSDTGTADNVLGVYLDIRDDKVATICGSTVTGNVIGTTGYGIKAATTAAFGNDARLSSNLDIYCTARLTVSLDGVTTGSGPVVETTGNVISAAAIYAEGATANNANETFTSGVTTMLTKKDPGTLSLSFGPSASFTPEAPAPTFEYNTPASNVTLGAVGESNFPDGTTYSYSTKWFDAATDGSEIAGKKPTATVDTDGNVFISVAADVPVGDYYLEITCTGTKGEDSTVVTLPRIKVTVSPKAISGTITYDNARTGATGPAFGDTMTASLTPAIPAENLDYQWYWSNDGTSGWTAIENASAAAFTINNYLGKYLCAEATGKGNYTGTITGTAIGPVAKATRTTPPADGEGYSYNYFEETILYDDTNYVISVDGTPEGAIASGASITPAGTLYIQYKENENQNGSTFRSFEVPSRQAMPTLTPTTETIMGKGDGFLSGVTAEMQYKLSGSVTWKDGTGANIQNAKNDTYLVRYAATDSNFASLATTVVFAEGPAAQVVFNSNGGSVIASQGGLRYGEGVSEPTAPTKEGVKFAGWYKDSGLTESWSFADDAVTTLTTNLYAKWVEQTFNIHGYIKNDSSDPISGVTVKLMRGNQEVGSAYTSATGSYTFTNVPAGEYQITASKGADVKGTEMVNCVGEGTTVMAPEITLVANAMSELDIVGDTPDVMVKGLNDLAQDVKTDTGATKAEVTMVVETKEPDDPAVTGNGDMDKILSEAGITDLATSSKKLDVIDMHIDYKEDGVEAPAITDTGIVLEIVIPFKTEGRTNIGLFRRHGTDATAFQFPTTSAAAVNGEYIEIGNGFIRVFARFFSTYAVAYTEVSSGSTGGGGKLPTSPIQTGSSNHGKVTTNVNDASVGQKVTITVTPDKGYTLETITVLDEKGKEVELTNAGNNTFTFIMPNGKVDVKATFMEDNTMLNYFVDVNAADYYYDAVLWAAEKGITSGTDSLHFSPKAPTTRGQMVTFLWRAAGCPEPTATKNDFTDIKSGSYYEKAVLWGIEKGLVKGVYWNAFAPDQTVTRAQAMTFLARFAGVTDEATGYVQDFTDVAANAYYNNAVAWASTNNITSGISANMFAPADFCQRGQLVTFLYRYFVK